MSHPAPTPIPYRADWRHQASCRGEYDLFDAAAEGDLGAVAEARAVCAGCPSRRPCLRDGVGEAYGVRAGLTEDDRDPLGRAYGAYRTAVAHAHGALAQTAAGDEGLREALAALEAEADTIGALALTVAAGGAAPAELRELVALALDARHATEDALAALYLRPLPSVARAVTVLMDAATQAAAVHTPTTTVSTTTRPSVPVIAAVA
ncbi:WhiB family transcriptional regulator [Frankia sp. AgB32]|uniref:WhiB family transcriptional regulator n=1 Tax=Frankia sp. AgB32 TaxID=631119 RepID=UPI00200C582C|nr:WhiB family transcriptional regulator [Frankia sp. AgB32]MCK9895209.1 WhiB family transcriptional regulator [Frankia sp. AgB32]